MDAGVPSWDGLLDRLAERSDSMKDDLVRHRKSGLKPEYLGQIIYNRHRTEVSVKSKACDMRDAVIDNSWAESIHKAIYKEVSKSIDKIIKDHPYLSELRDLARKVPLVINFNFDDILSESIGRQVEKQKSNEGNDYTVVWEPPLVDRLKTTTVYHVNGILPRVVLKKRSPSLIFTEDAFSDALARSPGVSGEYIFLRFVQNTMLIIGHSLSDSSLKNYLRKNRDKSPANHHYMIYWLDKDDLLNKKQIKDIFDANLDLYNLITIFLTSEEIHAVLSILNSDPRDFRDVIDDLGPQERHRYHYYIVGPVAAGKSSLLEQLRCFSTFEEWTRPPPKEMYLSNKKLSDNQKRKVDKFIYSELKEKNIRMHEADIGFHFMDRAPLDLYAFSDDEEENKEKSKQIDEKVTRDRPLQNGEIIFLTASGQKLVERNMGRGRLPESSGDEKHFTEQGDYLRDIYGPVIVINNDNISSGEIGRQIARHVLFEEYDPADLGKIMDRYR